MRRKSEAPPLMGGATGKFLSRVCRVGKGRVISEVHALSSWEGGMVVESVVVRGNDAFNRLGKRMPRGVGCLGGLFMGSKRDSWVPAGV